MSRHRSPEPRPPPSRWWYAAGMAATVPVIGLALAAMHYGDAISVDTPPAATTHDAVSSSSHHTPAPIYATVTEQQTVTETSYVTPLARTIQAPPLPQTVTTATEVRTVTVTATITETATETVTVTALPTGVEVDEP